MVLVEVSGRSGAEIEKPDKMTSESAAADKACTRVFS